MLRINASHEMFDIVNDIVYRIAACKNPQVFWGEGKDVPEPEKAEELSRLYREFNDIVTFIKLMS